MEENVSMIYLVSKFIISAGLIVLISEISKRSTLIGGLFASLPFISILAMIWLYSETKNTAAVAQLSKDIFWLVLPSLILFIALPILLKQQVNFYLALLIAAFFTVIGYGGMIFILRQ